MRTGALFGLWGLLLPAVAGADAWAPPAGYYDGAEGKAGLALESALHDIIDGHTIIPYGWSPYQDLDEAPGDPTKVLLLYSGTTRAKTENGGAVGDWNREHIWPKSYGIGSDGADTSDVFNLRPADVQVNAERANLYFDETDPALAVPLQFSAPGCSRDFNSWEPRPEEKGDIARSCFYMAVRYDGSDFATEDLTLGDSPSSAQARFGRLLTLLAWHREDPVSDAERERNQRVFADYQHNRNPFVDRPEFAERIFLAGYPGLDSDADGIADYWEWTQVGDADGDGDSDSDADGMPLLAEFAMLGDPRVPDTERSPRLFRNDDVYRFEFRRNRAATQLDYVVEESDALESTSWSEVVGTSETEEVDADLEVVTVVISVDPTKTRRFFRLRLEKTP